MSAPDPAAEVLSHYTFAQEVQLYFRSFVAVIGSILVWTGAWNILDEHVGEQSLLRDLVYIFLGIFLLLATNTFFINVGIPTLADIAQRHREWQQKKQRANHEETPPRSPELYLRSIFAFPGTILAWLGIFNLFDQHFPFPGPAWVKTVSCIVGGFLLMVVTRTLISKSGVELDDDDDEHNNLLDEHRQTKRAHQRPEVIDLANATVAEVATFYVRGLLALVGPVMFWVGIYNVLEEHVADHAMERELVYMAVGLFMLTITNALVGASMVEQTPDEMERRRKAQKARRGEQKGGDIHTEVTRSLAFLYTRSAVAFLGYLVFWTGFEALLNEHLWHLSWAREITYLALGFLLLALTGTLHVNTGVLTPMSYTTNYAFFAQKMQDNTLPNDRKAGEDAASPSGSGGLEP